MSDARRPNFIVILTDDQGYADLSCMGTTDFHTPHLDQLAETGARFTDWYSNSPVCSPARASLMSGRYPGNAGARSIFAGHRTATGMPNSRVTSLATALKDRGYRTGMFGKWHLGLADGCRPEDHGFDEWWGFLAGCVDYYSHIFYWQMGSGKNAVHDLWHNGQEAWANGEYLTEAITRRSVDFIRDAAEADDPFFTYVAYNAPHYPMHAPAEYLDRFRHLSPDRRIMAAMISAVDDGVGEIVAELKRTGQYENTCIVFSSDNGPSTETRNWLDGCEDPYYGGSAGIFRGSKFSLFEGGIRVPGIVSYPDRVPGGQVLDQPVAHMDVFPTLVSLAGGDLSQYDLDGRDILPVLVEGAESPHEEIYWEIVDQLAVRRGDWKLVLDGMIREGETRNHPDPVHLSNLAEDLSERNNLAEQHPEITEQLTTSARNWLAELQERYQRDFAPLEAGTTGRT